MERIGLSSVLALFQVLALMGWTGWLYELDALIRDMPVMRYTCGCVAAISGGGARFDYMVAGVLSWQIAEPRATILWLDPDD